MTFIEISPDRWVNLDSICFITFDICKKLYVIEFSNNWWPLKEEEYVVLKSYLKGEKK